MAEIIHRDLSFVINGCIFYVHNDVGPGVREESYQKAMESRLTALEKPYISKPSTRCELIHRGEVADVFEPDFIVCQKIILELKAQREGLNRVNFMQVVNYLKFWDLSLGLLVNFSEASAVIQRIPHHDKQSVCCEDYSALKSLVTDDLRATLAVVRDSLLAIYEQYGVGYWDTTYRALVVIELRHRGLDVHDEVTVFPEIDGVRLPQSRITALRINQEILVQVEALHEAISARVIRTMQTHLRFTGAKFGLIAHFGRDRFEIQAVRPKLT